MLQQAGKLSQQQPCKSLEFCFMVPYEWWQKSTYANQKQQNKNNLPQDSTTSLPFAIQSNLSPFPENHKTRILKSLQEKMSMLNIDQVTILPKPKENSAWKPMPMSKYSEYRQLMPFPCAVPLTWLQTLEKQSLFFQVQENHSIINILMCSSRRSQLLMGYVVDTKTQLKKKIEDLVYFFGFRGIQKSKLSFLSKHQQLNILFDKIEFQDQLDFESIKPQILMIHGLTEECQDDCATTQNMSLDSLCFDRHDSEYGQEANRRRVQSHTNGNQRISDRQIGSLIATTADFESQARQLSTRTMSTGAETPFSFDELDNYQNQALFRQYQNHRLFGEKSEEQIQVLREYAEKCTVVNAEQLIPVPCKSEDQQNSSFRNELSQELERMAFQIEQSLRMRNLYNKETYNGKAENKKSFMQQMDYQNLKKELSDLSSSTVEGCNQQGTTDQAEPEQVDQGERISVNVSAYSSEKQLKVHFSSGETEE